MVDLKVTLKHVNKTNGNTWSSTKQFTIKRCHEHALQQSSNIHQSSGNSSGSSGTSSSSTSSSSSSRSSSSSNSSSGNSSNSSTISRSSSSNSKLPQRDPNKTRNYHWSISNMLIAALRVRSFACRALRAELCSLSVGCKALRAGLCMPTCARWALHHERCVRSFAC